MKHDRFALQLSAALIAGALQIPATTSYSCGVVWRKPKTHFDGVNEYGAVSFWDQIGELDAGNGVELPLIIGFRSDWERNSPYLGFGWFLGLCDSCFIQRDSDAFDMIQPDGYTVPFGRDPKNPVILNGAKGWKAEIKTDSIIAYASCGWKLTFAKGRLSQIGLPNNRTLDIRRDAKGIATEIVSENRVLLKVEKDSRDIVTGLLLGNKKIGLEAAKKVRVLSVQGNNLISTTDSAIGKITFPDNGIAMFEYGLNEDIQPTLKITSAGEPSPRMITWDPATQTILSDGRWNYQVKQSQQPGGNASIERTDNAGNKEFWHFDSAKGVERSLTRSGKIVTKTWFTSGFLAGKPRSTEVRTADGKKDKFQKVYNEEGILVRETRNGEHYRSFLYDERGRLSKIINADQSVTELVREGGTTVRRFLSSEGKPIRETPSTR